MVEAARSRKVTSAVDAPHAVAVAARKQLVARRERPLEHHSARRDVCADHIGSQCSVLP